MSLAPVGVSECERPTAQALSALPVANRVQKPDGQIAEAPIRKETGRAHWELSTTPAASRPLKRRAVGGQFWDIILPYDLIHRLADIAALAVSEAAL